MASPGRPANTDPSTATIGGVDPRRQLSVLPRALDYAAYNAANLGKLTPPYGNQCKPGYLPPDLIDEMLVHPKVYQAVHLLKSAILADGGRAIPAVPPSDSNFKKAKEYAEFCMFNLRFVRGSWHGTARQMLDGTFRGEKLAVKSYRDQTWGKYKGKLVLDRLNVLPNNLYNYLWNEYRDVVAVSVGGTNYYASTLDRVVYPREKFAAFCFRTTDDNPLGNSVLAAAYEPFYRSVLNNPELMAYIAQFSRPSIAAIAPGVVGGVIPSDVPLYQMNEDGTVKLDENGQLLTVKDTNGDPVKIPAQQAMTLGLQKYEAGAIIVLPGDAAIQLLQAAGGGESVLRFNKEDTDRDIMAAILGTDQITESRRVVPSGNAEASESTLGLGVQDGKRAMEEMVENDLFYQIIEFNYGENALDLLPIYDLGSMRNPRLIALMNSVAALIVGGAFDKSQWWQYATEVGLPLPDDEAKPVVDTAKQQAQAGGVVNTPNPQTQPK